MITIYVSSGILDIHCILFLHRSSGKKLLDLLTDLDRVLATDSHFLLGRWIASARKLGLTTQEKTLYEYNARNQLTLWGPTANVSVTGNVLLKQYNLALYKGHKLKLDYPVGYLCFQGEENLFVVNIYLADEILCLCRYWIMPTSNGQVLSVGEMNLLIV